MYELITLRYLQQLRTSIKPITRNYILSFDIKILKSKRLIILKVVIGDFLCQTVIKSI